MCGRALLIYIKLVTHIYVYIYHYLTRYRATVLVFLGTHVVNYLAYMLIAVGRVFQPTS